MERKYKDSGIEWIGKIPETWEVSQLSNLFKEHSKRNIGIQETNLLSLSYGSIIRKDINDNGGLLPESFEGYNIIEKDDIVFRLTDLQNDKRSLRTGLVKERGIITSAYVTVRKRDYKNSSSYFHYLFHSCDECKIFYGLGAGVRQGMNFQELKKLGIVVPPLSEQKRIADYLDEKCGEIDSLIALQEQMIEKLKAYKQSVITEAVTKGLDPNAKLVPSGIDWIGDIPEGWEVCRFKSYIRLHNEKCSETAAFKVNLENIESKSGRFIPTDSKYEGEGTSFRKGDVLFGKLRPYLAKVFAPETEGSAIGDIYVFRPTTRIDTDFLKYTLLADTFVTIVDSSTYGTKMPRANWEFISCVPIAIPLLSEQQTIALYLDEKCAGIDRLIALKQQKIETLKDYKKSVIYEAVTGKTIIE